jgi:type I restriction enzyme R subunit
MIMCKVAHLTENGTIEPGRVYEDPFTAIAPQGPEQIFSETEINEIFGRIRALDETVANL